MQGLRQDNRREKVTALLRFGRVSPGTKMAEHRTPKRKAKNLRWHDGHVLECGVAVPLFIQHNLLRKGNRFGTN